MRSLFDNSEEDFSNMARRNISPLDETPSPLTREDFNLVLNSAMEAMQEEMIMTMKAVLASFTTGKGKINSDHPSPFAS